jgi:hypothetical protein
MLDIAFIMQIMKNYQIIVWLVPLLGGGRGGNRRNRGHISLGGRLGSKNSITMSQDFEMKQDHLCAHSASTSCKRVAILKCKSEKIDSSPSPLTLSSGLDSRPLAAASSMTLEVRNVTSSVTVHDGNGARPSRCRRNWRKVFSVYLIENLFNKSYRVF